MGHGYPDTESVQKKYFKLLFFIIFFLTEGGGTKNRYVTPPPPLFPVFRPNIYRTIRFFSEKKKNPVQTRKRIPRFIYIYIAY